jgi:two-component system sensor histidine kinase RegB
VETHRRPDVAVDVSVIEHGANPLAEPRLDPTPEVKHALGNLIDNAIQFAEREITITVDLRPAQVDVVIEDDGPGFPPEVLEFLGEPYVSTRHETGGLGLGVFIAETLLARTGASLQFGNQAKGARVVVTWRRGALDDNAPEI